MFRIMVVAAMLLGMQARTCVAQAQGQQVVYATQFKPPADYTQWYAEAERCVGMKGEFGKIVWVAAPHPWNQQLVTLGGKEKRTFGLWHALEGQPDSAMILLNQEDWDNEFYVKHEMLHDILWRNGWHSPESVPNVPDSINIRLAHPVPPYDKCAPTYIDEMRLKWKLKVQQPWKQVYRP